MKPLRFFCALALAVCISAAVSSMLYAAESDIVAGLRPEHPRLIVTAADWTSLAQRRKANTQIDVLLTKLVAQARDDLKAPPLSYKKDGKRLLAVSREALRRVLFWSAAFRLTGESEFAQRAEKELLGVAEFKDWNPSHFLDVAEMTAACAFGYDWLYDQLPPASRSTIRGAIVEKGLRQGVRPLGWQKSENNWNQVCLGGLTLGALAIAEEEPAAARKLLELARRDNPNGLRPYAPDGVYPEGPGYWAYGTSYEVLMISALQSALGTDWGLSAAPGFLESCGAQVQLCGPTGMPYSFSDATDSTGLEPTYFWFAKRQHQPGLLRFQTKYLDRMLASRAGQGRGALPKDYLLPLLPFWMDDGGTAGQTRELPLDWYGNGPNPVGVFRTSWTDPNAVYLALKGGSASLSHGHMDAGSFVLDAGGVRWACDLGRQDYLSLESKGVDLWNSRQDGGRWSVFRLNNFSHNTLTIGNELHRVAGMAKITEFHGAPRREATVDLSEVFAGQAGRVVRRFELADDRRVSIRDELTGVKPGQETRWAMVTRAKVELNGDQATLRQDGKMLRAKVVSPAGAQFSVIPADPPRDNFNAPNPGASILIVNVAAPADGKIELAVVLTPPAE